MTRLEIWRTEYQPEPDDPPTGEAWEVVDLDTPEADTLMIGTLERCQDEYPEATRVGR